MAKEINMVYLTLWMFTISIGMYQFGYAIGHYNILTKMMYKQYKANGDPVLKSQDDFNSAATTIIPIGAAFGALTASSLCSLGRKNALLIANAVIAIGSGITLIFNFWALIGGRLLLGYGAGAFTVIAPVFISEASPPEVAGSMGAINQFMCCVGIMIADILGFIIPYEYKKGEIEVNKELLTSKTWRIIFAIPLCLAILQSLLVLLIFRNDTPKFYTQKGDHESVERVNQLIYKGRETELNNSVVKSSEESAPRVSLKAHCGSKYRNAFIIGNLLSMFQQLTGINAVIFYSNDIFTGGKSGYESENAAKIGTMLVGVVNWAFAMVAIPLLVKFGRKTLLIYGQIGMGISLLALGI